MTHRAAPIRVLVVEPSRSVGTPASSALLTHSDMEVVGTVSAAAKAMEVLQARNPQVVVIDSSLPGKSGFELTRQIMQSHPLPVVMVSEVGDPDQITATFAALEAGAVALVARPEPSAGAMQDEQRRRFVQMIRAMAEIKVVRRWSKDRLAQLESLGQSTQRSMEWAAPEIRIVAIGASTGGPLVLQSILSRLPEDFAAPILIVQHIAPGFVRGLANWLRTSTKLAVHIPDHTEPVFPGRVYLAPDASHMEIGGDGRIALSPVAQRNGSGPSVSRLFASVAARYGKHAIGVLLTGMGKDGAAELGLMKQSGALTIVQDRQSSVVYGMPGEAVSLGAACFELTPEDIAVALRRAVETKWREPIGTGAKP